MRKLKISASILAILMLMSTFMSIVATAYATQPQADIVIENDFTTSGVSIQGKTFDIYKVFDAVVHSGSGNIEDSITYSVNDDFVAYFENLLSITDDANFDMEVITFINGLKKGETAVNNVSNMQELATELRTFALSENLTAVHATEYQKVNTIERIKTTNPLNPGYYMVLDASENVSSSDCVLAGALVTLPGRVMGDVSGSGDLTGDAVIKIKGSAPRVDKQIWHNDKKNSNDDYSQESGYNGSWDEVGDYQIGDTVEFLIKATVPSDITGYKNYQYIITDTLSDGLKLNVSNSGKTVVVYPQKPTAGVLPAAGSLHIETINNNGFVLEFDIPEIKEQWKDLTEFYLYYTATVTEDAVVAKDYETNTVTLDYSNNPYDENSFGKDEDRVFSYTFDIDITKTSGDAVTPLEGAVFALYEEIPGDVLVQKQIYLQEDTKATLSTGVPTYFTTTEIASDTDGNYKGVITTRIADGANGKFNIVGLDDAQRYILKEIKAPQNYNPSEPITIKVNADYITGFDGVPVPNVTVNVNDKDIAGNEITVINTSTTLLPETGGMGTIIFTVVGLSIMLVAGAVFASKKAKEYQDQDNDN